MIKKLLSTSLNALSYISAPLAGKWAFYLFSMPIGIAKSSVHESKQMQEAKHDFLVVDGLKVAIYCWGNGQKPILFAHGWNSRASRCARLVPLLLKEGFSVVSFDAQGHGASEGKTTNIVEYTKIILALYQKYGVFEAIISHSFGTICSFQALRDGVEAKCLISLNGVADFNYLTKQFCAVLNLNRNIENNLRIRTEKAFLPRENIWETFSVDHNPHEIKVPILLISDEHDQVVTKSQAKKIYDAYNTQVEILETKNLGHHRAIKDPKVIQRVITFLNKNLMLTNP